jgi:hypothetical protein
MVPLRLLLGALWLACMPALACDYPDEGTMPLHRAVTKVELIPEIDDWAAKRREAGALVQFVVLLDQPVWMGGRCYWTVDVASDGTLWRRFYVTPDGKKLRPLRKPVRP